MSEETPEHRRAHPIRSGDDHLIGEDGDLRNLDQEARDAAAAEAEKPSRRKRSDDATGPTDEPAA